jgi:signal transduction histidine kinase/ActR/RegA family two-component response regulator
MPSAVARWAEKHITLRGALIALGVLLVAINVGSAVWDVHIDAQRTETRARRDFSNLTGVLAEQTASSLEAVDLVLRDTVRDGSPAKAAATVPRLRDEMVGLPHVAAFLMLDARGRAVGRTNEAPPVDTRLGERPFFTAHRDGLTRGLFISEPYRAPTTGRWRFAMSRRFDAPEGRFGGVVAALIEIESFDRLYRTVEVGDGGFIALRSRDGTVITRVPDPTGSRGGPFPNPDIDAAIRREGRFTGWTMSPVLNEPVLVAASAVRGFPLHILSGADERSVFASWRSETRRITARTLLTSAAMLVLIALAAWGLARREAERARLEQRLRQGEKMEAVGRLAGGIAHDFNNILGGILGYGEMLQEETPEGSRLRRYATNVLTAANRARDLVDQILAYSRSQLGKRAPVDLCRIVAETLELVRGSLAEGIRLETDLPAAPLLVSGDATQLHQVLMNLCTNAIQAMAEEGRLRVTLARADVEAGRAFAHGHLASGSYVRLTVEDTGPGMDEATLTRMFEPFFTTKEVGKGTGLGLSLVYGIVADSGGAIDVASAPGRGSAFMVYLPRIDAAAEDTDEERRPLARGNGERVLVIDDEEALVALAGEVLQRLGYRPTGFCDARAALAEFEAAPHRFDAVITDEVMPEMTGTELTQLLRRRRPDLPILLVSGYIGPMMTERALAAGVSKILKKPVPSSEMAAALAAVLGRNIRSH